MNASLKVMLLSICLFAFTSNGGAASNSVEELFVEFISSGKSSRLKSYFNSRLHVRIENEGQILSAQQAGVVLEEFFAQNPSGKFKVSLNGGKDQNRYLSGVYVTHEAAYNISIFYTLADGNKREVIQQIRISTYDGQQRVGESADRYSS